MLQRRQERKERGDLQNAECRCEAVHARWTARRGHHRGRTARRAWVRWHVVSSQERMGEEGLCLAGDVEARDEEIVERPGCERDGHEAEQDHEHQRGLQVQRRSQKRFAFCLLKECGGEAKRSLATGALRGGEADS